MATETLYATSHITGSCATPNNALGAADAVFTTNSGNASWDSRWAIGNPVNPLNGTTSTLTVRMGKPSTGGGNPTYTAELWVNGSAVQTLASSTTIADSTSVDVPFTLINSGITDMTGVELRLIVSGNGGGPNQRTINVDSITWTPDTAALTTVGDTAPTAWNVLTPVVKSASSAWSIAAQVGDSVDVAWDVLTGAAAETIYVTGLADDVATINSPSNVIGASDDTFSTDTSRLWYALFNMSNPASGMFPETGTINVRAKLVSGTNTQTYALWLYEDGEPVEQIVSAQGVSSSTAATFQHTVNLGKIKNPANVQVRMQTSTDWTYTIVLDAIWIEFTPVTGTVRASVDTAWDVYGGATEVAVWDFAKPSRTPAPASVAPGWNVSAWSVGAGSLNSGLGVGATDYDHIYRNYFVGGADPTSHYPTEPVGRVASTAAGAAAAVSGNKYIEMTFSRTDNGAFTPAGLDIKTARGGSGTPRGMVIRGSHNGYASDIDTMGDFSTVRPTWEQWNLDLSSVGEVTTLTLRFYIYSTGSTSTVAFDDIVLTATPTASTTTVGKTVDTAWDVAAQLGDSIASAWNVLTTVGDSAPSAWDVLTPVGDSIASAWDVLTTVGSSVDAAWSIAATVEDNATSAWDVLEVVSDTAPSAWDVLTPVVASTSTAWDVLEEVGDSAGLAWDVLEEVPASAAAAWSVLAGVTASTDSAWDVRSTVTASAASAWTVLATVTDVRSSAWNVEAIGQVSAGAATAWSIASTVGAQSSSAWDVLTSVTGSEAVGWDVLAAVTTSQASAWSVAATATGSVSSGWDVLTVASASAPTSWNVEVLGQVVATAGTAWDVLATVAGSTASSWSVLAGVAASTSSGWDVLTSVGAARASAWNVYMSVGPYGGTLVAVELGWDVRAQVDASVASGWDAAATVVATRGSAWHVYLLTEFDDAELVVGEPYGPTFAATAPAGHPLALGVATGSDFTASTPAGHPLALGTFTGPGFTVGAPEKG